jgi:cbb3-type cytochrome oxidase maturation protein
MQVVVVLLIASVVVAAGFLVAFLWSARRGQYDDLDTPPVRMLYDDIKAGEKPVTPAPSPKSE